MALSIHRLRRVFAVAAIAIAVVVAGFYFARRITVERARVEIPKKLGVDIQQSTEGFTLSKSDGGRTLFTVRASKAVQFKSGGRAELKDVSIVVYGRQSDRFDQIYGTDFEYDPQTSEVRARGEVHIDLEADTQGRQRADQAPPEELKNPIHLRTSGLVFNQKTGIAGTEEAIEFRIPQASGSAKGARYDSRTNVLGLESEIRVTITGRESAHLAAARGEVTKEPRRAVLHQVSVERAGGSLTADRVTIFLGDDNSVERVLAEGNLHAAGPSSQLRAPRAEFHLGRDQTLRSAVLTGGVLLDASTDADLHAQAASVRMEFTSGNRVAKVRAAGNAHFTQVPRKVRGSSKGAGQTMELAAETVDFSLGNKGNLERAVTSGASRITLAPLGDDGKPGGGTVITAGHFAGEFGARNRLKSLHGEPEARVVSASSGEPDKVSSSRELDVSFGPTGGVSSIVQQGSVRYTEGARSASAEKARYTPGTDELVLTGSPRYSESAIATSAKLLRLNRRSGEASAEGEVKTTYLPAGERSGDGLLGGNGPIHVTAGSMKAGTATSVARYRGDVRLWQGANLVEASMIEFDRERRSLLATGSEGAPEGRATRVSTVFLHTDKDGKITPVTVTAARLRYGDTLRKARFDGGVTLQGADLIISAEHANVFLAAREDASGDGTQTSRMESVVAEGGVVIQEARRKATGEKLVYTAAEGKVVLTGGRENPPSIFDAELGTTTGDSLTFFMRDDRVLVGSSSSSPTITQTRVKK